MGGSRSSGRKEFLRIATKKYSIVNLLKSIFFNYKEIKNI